MANKYVLVQELALRKMIGVFADQDELSDFVRDLFVTIHIITDIIEKSEKATKEDDSISLTGKLLFTLARFVRDNMDTIQELTNRLDYAECDESEMATVHKLLSLGGQTADFMDYTDIKKGQTP
jgi:hypothetical protein